MVQAAVGLLKEEILAQPMRFAKGCAVNFLKYMFCPVDSLAACASRSFNSPMAPMGAPRLALTLLWLPLWLVCLIPQRLPRQRSLYWLAMLCLLAIVALSAPVGAGGAIPVPALFLTMAVGAVNVTAASAAWRRRSAPAPEPPKAPQNVTRMS